MRIQNINKIRMQIKKGKSLGFLVDGGDTTRFCNVLLETCADTCKFPSKSQISYKRGPPRGCIIKACWTHFPRGTCRNTSNSNSARIGSYFWVLFENRPALYFF